jgi:hypothetical protein
MSYTIRQEVDRVTAVDQDGATICGAYQAHDCWNLYVGQLVNDTTHLRTPPHHEHYWGAHGLIDSLAWVECIAALYTAAHHEGTTA